MATSLSSLPIARKREILQLYEERERLLILRDKGALPANFAAFCKAAWHVIEPGKGLVWNWHMDIVCAHMQAVAEGKIRRLIVNVPPRSAKSNLISVLFNAWAWASNPSKQFLTVSHEEGLAIRDAQRTRLLVRSDWYQARWGGSFSLAGDQNEKKFFQTSANGHRNAVGINAGVTGKGGDIILVDDPHSFKGATSTAERQTTLDAYDMAISTRLNSPSDGAIVVIMQRLNGADLTGHLLKGTEHWDVVILPMRYEGKRYSSPLGSGFDDPRAKDGELLMPERFPEETVEALELRLGDGAAGQLQQRPVSRGGGVLKEKWWKVWDRPLPHCEHVFLSWDTAFTADEKKKAAHSAMLGFGLFWDESFNKGKGAYALILLCSWNGMVDYVDLRAKALEVNKIYSPDRHLIEKKASGISILQELRRAGIRTYPYNPDRDKTARAESVQPLMQAGLLYRPDKKWAEKIVAYVSEGEKGAPPAADYTDCLTQALIYLQKGLWVRVDPDEDDFIISPTIERRLYG
jgi:phage terminase large subunit-like protein